MASETAMIAIAAAAAVGVVVYLNYQRKQKSTQHQHQHHKKNSPTLGTMHAPPPGCTNVGPGLYNCTPGVMKGPNVLPYNITQISDYRNPSDPQQPEWVVDGVSYWYRTQLPSVLNSN